MGPGARSGRTRAPGESAPPRFASSPGRAGGGLGRARPNLGAEEDAGRGGPLSSAAFFLSFSPFPPSPSLPSPPSARSPPFRRRPPPPLLPLLGLCSLLSRFPPPTPPLILPLLAPGSRPPSLRSEVRLPARGSTQRPSRLSVRPARKLALPHLAGPAGAPGRDAQVLCHSKCLCPKMPKPSPHPTLLIYDKSNGVFVNHRTRTLPPASVFHLHLV